MPCPLAELNSSGLPRFLEVCGPFYEHSPWVAERAFARRPFASREALHAALVEAVAAATPEEQLGLIRCHPDLAGRLAREGGLTAASAAEQASAGLDRPWPGEVEAFERCTRAYRERFGFPFVICVREHGRQAILAACAARLRSTPEAERLTALGEIGRIGRLRLFDAVSEP